VSLSSGYVTPTSGDCTTEFTYRIKYWNTENVAPDSVSVAVWWGSRSRAHWYAMWPLTPSDTNYTDGAWYTFKMRGLDSSPHAFRFVAQVGATTANWPTPGGPTRPGRPSATSVL
jgi:hypothetical protein